METNRNLIYFLCGVFLFSVISISVSGSYKFSCCLECIKDGPQEVVTDASGNAEFILNEEKGELVYTLEVEKITGAYMAHLHIGSSQKQGPIAVWLYPEQDNNAHDRIKRDEFSGVLAKGVVRAKDLEAGITFAELVEAMQEGRAYVNVHTQKYIPGEIGGQVKPQI